RDHGQPRTCTPHPPEAKHQVSTAAEFREPTGPTRDLLPQVQGLGCTLTRLFTAGWKSSWYGGCVALNIKDEETDRLARELAAATGESITVAARRAIEERLARVRRREAHPAADELQALIFR